MANTETIEIDLVAEDVVASAKYRHIEMSIDEAEDFLYEQLDALQDVALNAVWDGIEAYLDELKDEAATTVQA